MLRAPYSINGHTLLIGASIGIAAIDRRTSDAADIMRRADVALYRAKNEGRSRACIYDANMDADLREPGTMFALRALVTGVSRGIGRSICLKLAEDAMSLVERGCPVDLALQILL